MSSFSLNKKAEAMCERRTKNPNHILKQQQKTQINAIDMLADTCLKQLKGDDRILLFLRKYWDAYFLTWLA